jgi:hypothetical protein
MVTRKHQNVVLYVHCLSCSKVTRIYTEGYSHVEIVVTGLIRKFQTFKENWHFCWSSQRTTFWGIRIQAIPLKSHCLNSGPETVYAMVSPSGFLLKLCLHFSRSECMVWAQRISSSFSLLPQWYFVKSTDDEAPRYITLSIFQFLISFRASLQMRYSFELVFIRCPGEILTETPIVPTDIFYYFPQSHL